MDRDPAPPLLAREPTAPTRRHNTAQGGVAGRVGTGVLRALRHEPREDLGSDDAVSPGPLPGSRSPSRAPCIDLRWSSRSSTAFPSLPGTTIPWLRPLARSCPSTVSVSLGHRRPATVSHPRRRRRRRRRRRDLPFPLELALRFDHQAHFHPGHCLAALARTAAGRGGQILEHTRARAVDEYGDRRRGSYAGRQSGPATPTQHHRPLSHPRSHGAAVVALFVSVLLGVLAGALLVDSPPPTTPTSRSSPPRFSSGSPATPWSVVWPSSSSSAFPPRERTALVRLQQPFAP